MSPSDNPFAIEPERIGFELMAHENGFRFWWASDLALLLGYEDLRTFRKAIDRAMQVCIQLGVPVTDNIVAQKRDVGGRQQEDYKLSRFACYLAAMNGDVRKTEVARAQAYFVTFAEACRVALTESDGVERVAIRGDVTDREGSLSRAASSAGVENYAFFQNAGYRGLYNMNLADLRLLKGVPARRSPLDFMGKTELAANLFRLTQTEERIKNQEIRGQKPLEKAATDVGRAVRQVMLKSGGTAPERLKPADDIQQVKKQIKTTQRTFQKIDRNSEAPAALPDTADLDDDADTGA